MRIPALLCIDVEPDERRVPVPAPPAWRGFEELLTAVPAIRAELAERSSAPATLSWFLRMDPQIEVAHGDASWGVSTYREALDGLVAEGDELAVHPHNWCWDGQRWISHQEDPTWVRSCVSMALDRFEDAFGRPCRAYRGGDRYFDDDVLRLVAERGVQVDLTMEPGAPRVRGLAADEPATGWIPGVPADRRAPFRPLTDAPLLAVPLTSGVGFQGGTPDGAGVPTSTLTLWTPPRAFRAALDVRLAEPHLTHVAFAIRTDVGIDRAAGAWFRENLRYVADRLGSQARWCTPSEAAERLAPCADARGAAPAPATDRAALVGAALERAVRDAELATMRLADEAEVRYQALQSSFEELAAAADERLALVHDLHAELSRLQAEVAAYATEAVGLRAAAAEGEESARRLAAVLATRWWRAHELVVGPALRLRSRRR